MTYLPLDTADLEQWKNDPISFYFKNKEIDFESVTLLRESAVSFINSVKIRFPKFLESYASQVKEELRTNYSDIDSTDINIVALKEALYNFGHQAIDIEDDQPEDSFLKILENEFDNLGDEGGSKIIKRRLVMIYSSVGDYFKKPKNQESKSSAKVLLERVLQILENDSDIVLKLSGVYFFMDFYNDYYLEKDTYQVQVNRILNQVWSLIDFLKTLHRYDAIDECLRLFNILTKKYLNVSQQCLEKFVSDKILVKQCQKEVLTVTIQSLALLEDDQITSEIGEFCSNLIVECLNSDDVFAKEDSLKLMLIYGRRLQNCKLESNPLTISELLLSSVEKVIEQIDKGDLDDILNVFLILEEIHFALEKGQNFEISTEFIGQVYSHIFKTCFEYAKTYENSYINLFTGYYASTIAITESGQHFKSVLCELRDHAKADLVDKLVNKKEDFDEYLQNIFKGFLSIFSTICLLNPKFCFIEDLKHNDHEIIFLEILTKLGEYYLQGAEELVKKLNDPSEDDEEKDDRYLPILFSVVYGVYGFILQTLNVQLGEAFNIDLFQKCKALLSEALKAKNDMVEISNGNYIGDCLRNLTKEAQTTLLFELPSKKKVLSKSKTDYIFKKFAVEGDLFKELIDDHSQ